MGTSTVTSEEAFCTASGKIEKSGDKRKLFSVLLDLNLIARTLKITFSYKKKCWYGSTHVVVFGTNADEVFYACLKSCE